jgi:hypothetical protein
MNIFIVIIVVGGFLITLMTARYVMRELRRMDGLTALHDVQLKFLQQKERQK